MYYFFLGILWELIYFHWIKRCKYTDICTFRLAGKNAYLLGFIDDYSRYIVGLGLYRSQPAANLLEVYCTAVGEVAERPEDEAGAEGDRPISANGGEAKEELIHGKTGEEVAGNLKKLFKQYGAPLFMKRDNGGNLNHIAVIDVLQEFGVLPLNNPAYYPQFNDNMERGQGEVKRELDNLIWEYEHPDVFKFAVKQAVHNVNHKPRPSLNGAWSCSVWQLHANVRFSQQQCFKAYNEICQLAFDIEKEVSYIDKELLRCKSWRKAVQTWLHVNGHIIIKRNGKVLPVSA